MRQAIVAIVTVLGALALSAIALKFSSLPSFWVGLILSGGAFIISAAVPRSLRLAVVLVGSLPIAVSLAEVFAAAPPQVSKATEPALDERDPLLGWRPRPSATARATATVDGETVYDVVYTIDASGHRVSPGDRGPSVEGCVFFFADSFVFGEGLKDSDTLPNKVGLKTDGHFRVINFAYSGYGAEHMLAQMERGELAAHPSCEPTHIIYAALPHHVHRAAGKTSFSAGGPRYRLRADGTPEYVGTDPDATDVPAWRKRIVGQLQKSRVYRGLVTGIPETTQADLDLYFALVKRAFALFAQRWPGARLDLISWDIHGFYAKDLATFHKGLETVGVTVHPIDRILPGYSSNPIPFSLHASELHPNAAAADRVATYVVQHLLGAGQHRSN